MSTFGHSTGPGGGTGLGFFALDRGGGKVVGGAEITVIQVLPGPKHIVFQVLPDPNIQLYSSTGGRRLKDISARKRFDAVCFESPSRCSMFLGYFPDMSSFSFQGEGFQDVRRQMWIRHV